MSSFAALLGRRRNQPTIVTEHVGAVPYRSRLASAAQRAGLRAGAKFATRRGVTMTALNDRVVAQMLDMAPGSTVVKIANGVDLTRFSPATTPRRSELRAALGWDRPTVLVVGRNAPKKRFDLVLGAARLLPAVRFVICGLDTEALGWSEPNVDIVGSVEQSALVDRYRAADLLLLPSEGEGQPLCVLEALACGLPVILGADEFVLAELPACVVPVSRTIEAVVDAIAATLPLGAEREAAAAQCVNAVADRGWTSAAQAYRALLARNWEEVRR